MTEICSVVVDGCFSVLLINTSQQENISFELYYVLKFHVYILFRHLDHKFPIMQIQRFGYMLLQIMLTCKVMQAPQTCVLAFGLCVICLAVHKSLRAIYLHVVLLTQYQVYGL